MVSETPALFEPCGAEEREMEKTRRKHTAAFKAKVALAAIKGDQDAGGVIATVPSTSEPDPGVETAPTRTSRKRLQPWRAKGRTGPDRTDRFVRPNEFEIVLGTSGPQSSATVGAVSDNVQSSQQ